MNAQTKQSVSTAAPTLATVIATVQKRGDCSPALRRDIVDAIETVARGLGQDPDAIPAIPGELRQRVDRVKRRDVNDITPGRWKDLVGLLDDGLALAGLERMPSRVQEDLSVSWRDPLFLLTDRYQRSHLRRLAVFCAARQISLEAVDDAVLDAYRAFLEEGLIDRPAQVQRDAVLAWNKAAASVEGWPQVTLKMPCRRGETSLPLSSFPASFSADVEAYIAELSGEDLLSKRSNRPASPVTLRTCELEIRRAATELVCGGHDPTSITGLNVLVERGAATLIVNRLWVHEGRQAKGQANNIGRRLLAIARHWVKASEETCAHIAELCRRTKPAKAGMTDKNAGRLMAFLNEDKVRRLVSLPQRLLERARLRPRTVSEAAAMQAAVGVAILLVAPMRARNLAELKVGETLRLADTPDGQSFIFIEAWRTKNKERLQYVLPSATAELIRVYLQEFRPLLVDGGSPWLFSNTTGGHKAASNLGNQIPLAIEAATGLTMNLHLFRHFCAFLFLKHHPGEYETVRRLLGHKSIATTVQFYCGLEQHEAFSRFDKVLDAYRDGQEGGTDA